MEFLIRNFDSSNPDPGLDRAGCRKRGMCDQESEDGAVAWEGFSGLDLGRKFVVIKCPEIKDRTELYPEGFRKVWRDDLKIEVVSSDKTKGEKVIKVTEVNAGKSLQNAVSGRKLDRIKAHLEKWGCTDHTERENELQTKFAVDAAVRSAEFWGVPAEKLVALAPAKEAYSAITEKIQVSLTTADSKESAAMLAKVMDVAGESVSKVGSAEVFEVSTDKVLEKIQRETKERCEQTYLYQQHRIDKATMDAAVAAGGMLTLTKAELLAAIVDAAAE
jgi:hypothetical protein